MKFNKRKILKITFFILIAVSVLALYFLNDYLKQEKLLFYSKGTDQKAFLNATWKMSVQEVERANDCELSEGYDLSMFEPDLNNLINNDRIQWKEGCDVNILGGSKTIYYDFFDNQLFRVKILGDVINKNETDSLVIEALKPKHGEIKRNDDNKYSGSFSSNDVLVNYSQYEYKNNDREIELRLRLELIYTPLYEEIKKVSEQDQKTIF